MVGFLRHLGVDHSPLDMSCQFINQRMRGEGDQMLPGDCPENDPFRCCIFEGIWKQTDAQNDFVRLVRKYDSPVFGQEFTPQLYLVLVLGFALSGSNAG